MVKKKPKKKAAKVRPGHKKLAKRAKPAPKHAPKKMKKKMVKAKKIFKPRFKPRPQPQPEAAPPSPGLYAGKILHFYPHICVGVIEVAAPLRQGERIRVIRDDGTDFEQSVTSMQIEHRQIFEAQKGQQIGIRLLQPAKKGAMVYKQV